MVTVQLYTYRAKITSVHDGDTVTADIDLGMNITIKDVKLRFLGINAPELFGAGKEEGLKSRDYVRGLILGKEVIIQTKKDQDEKYGRLLATIYYEGKDISLNKHLVEAGYAKVY